MTPRVLHHVRSVCVCIYASMVFITCFKLDQSLVLVILGASGIPLRGDSSRESLTEFRSKLGKKCFNNNTVIVKFQILEKRNKV